MTQRPVNITLCAQDSVVEAFGRFFSDSGYHGTESIAISSNGNPSTRFIGAAVAVLTPLLVSGDIPNEGTFIAQNCVKTHALRDPLDSVDPPRNSFFRAMCALVRSERLPDLAMHSVQLLTEHVGIKPEDLAFDLHFEDRDLLRSFSRYGLPVTANTKGGIESYRHGYGIEGVSGRDVGIELRGPNGLRDNIAVIIDISRDDLPYAAEFALGDSSIAKQQMGLRHFLDCYNVRDNDLVLSDGMRLRLKDAVLVSMALLQENLRPGAANNQTRLLRSYLKRISLYRRIAEMEDDSLLGYLQRYEYGVLPFDISGLPEKILEFVQIYEKKLQNKPYSELSIEDKNVIDVLRKAKVQ